MYKIHYAPEFKKQYKKLPLTLQKKFIKQQKYLLKDYRHPSLQAKKMSGRQVYEAKLDYHNRFVYIIIDEEIWFLAIGPHDKGLGKK